MQARMWVARMGMVVASSAAAAALGGCTSMPEAFTPTERATAASPEGYTAADYDVVIEGDVAGEVKMWSSGAFMEDVGEDDKRTLVHVGLEVENVSDKPLTVDVQGMELDSATMDDNVLPPIPVLDMEGSPRIEPGADTELAVYFELPRGVKPQHLDAFRVRWSIGSAKGNYKQSTPFLETYPVGSVNVDATYGYYYTPYYDPFIEAPPHRNRVIIVHPQPYRVYHR